MLQVNNLAGFAATEPLITEAPPLSWSVAYGATLSGTWSGTVSLANKTLITRIPQTFLKAEGTKVRLYLERGALLHTVNRVTISYSATGTTSDLYDAVPGSIVTVTNTNGLTAWSLSAAGSTSGQLVISDTINFEVITTKALLIALHTGATTSTASRRTSLPAIGSASVQTWVAAATGDTTLTENRLTGNNGSGVANFARTDNASHYIARIEVA